MKKVFATILALVYLATSSGAVINTHYCMGEVAFANKKEKDKCGKCGMKNKKGCCENRVVVLKAQTEHQVIARNFLVQPNVVLLHHSYSLYTASVPAIPLNTIVHNNSPPGPSGAFRCVLYSVFRI